MTTLQKALVFVLDYTKNKKINLCSVLINCFQWALTHKLVYSRCHHLRNKKIKKSNIPVVLIFYFLAAPLLACSFLEQHLCPQRWFVPPWHNTVDQQYWKLKNSPHFQYISFHVDAQKPSGRWVWKCSSFSLNRALFDTL